MLTIHDSERPSIAERMHCTWALLGTLGTYAGTAASAVGTAATTAGTAIADAATNIAGSTGIPQLATTASNAIGGLGGEAGYLQSLGQAVPQGVDLAGMQPGLMDTGPGFFRGFAQGMSGTLGQYAEPSAGTGFGQGLGMLGNFIDRARGLGGGGGGMNAGQLLRSALAQYGLPEQGVRYVPGQPLQPQQGMLNLHLGGNASAM